MSDVGTLGLTNGCRGMRTIISGLFSHLFDGYKKCYDRYKKKKCYVKLEDPFHRYIYDYSLFIYLICMRNILYIIVVERLFVFGF